MILIADGGSTTTEWCLCNEGILIERFFTGGMNPYILDDAGITQILQDDVKSHITDGTITEIYYYGAGCRDVVIPRVTSLFASVFPNADGMINIYSDVLASARALFGNSMGIACILGTGSNSCLYDGTNITEMVSPLGYILGDEGSGADIGRHIVNAVFKRRLPEDLREMFVNETGLSIDEVMKRTYKGDEPGKFLASFTHFAAEHIDRPEIYDIVKYCFRRFFQNNISVYYAQDCFIGAIGSVAYHFNNILQQAANEEGYFIKSIIKSPVEGLLQYHNIRIEEN